jgi:hypothetical protein
MQGSMSMVGPVLIKGPVADAVCTAIQQLNPGATVSDRGAYLRIFAPSRCVLTSEAVTAALGRSFHMSAELAHIMCSFRGELSLTHERAVWQTREASSG